MNRIINQNRHAKYYFQVANLVDDLGLSPYAFRLYCHLVRISSLKDCKTRTRDLAEACKMSLGQVSKAKQELIEAGLISIQAEGQGRQHVITIEDITPRNVAHCANITKPQASNGSPQKRDAVCSPGEQRKDVCSCGEQTCSCGEQTSLTPTYIREKHTKTLARASARACAAPSGSSTEEDKGRAESERLSPVDGKDSSPSPIPSQPLSVEGRPASPSVSHNSLDPVTHAFQRATTAARTPESIIRAWNGPPHLTDLCLSFVQVFGVPVTKADKGKWLAGARRLEELRPTEDEMRQVRDKAGNLAITHPGAAYELIKAVRAQSPACFDHPLLKNGRAPIGWRRTPTGMQPLYE